MGDTSYEVFVLRRHAKAVRVPKLDFGPGPVSIVAAAGGDERFTHRYSGHSLRLLKGILAKGGVVELRIRVEVRDASGDVAHGRSMTRLRA